MNTTKNISEILSTKISEVSTKVANTSTKQTLIWMWQEPKMPKALLKKSAK